MFSYFRLKDSQYNGLIVKKDRTTRKEFYCDEKQQDRKPISIMIHYFWPESETFEMFEELSEEKVKVAIS